MLDANLILARKKAGMTQEDVAKKLNVKRQTYSAYERGVSIPDANTLSILAELFGSTTDYLLGREQKNAPAISDKGWTEIQSIFASLTLENRAKLLELSRLYLDAQNKNGENK